MVCPTGEWIGFACPSPRFWRYGTGGKTRRMDEMQGRMRHRPQTTPSRTQAACSVYFPFQNTIRTKTAVQEVACNTCSKHYTNGATAALIGLHIGSSGFNPQALWVRPRYWFRVRIAWLPRNQVVNMPRDTPLQPPTNSFLR